MLPDNTGEPEYDGIPIKLKGKEFILPPCSIGTLKRHAKKIGQFGSAGADFAMSEEAINTMVGVVTEALKRNYPTMTADIVEECIGVDIMQDVFQQAMDVSGLLRKQFKLEAAAGKAAGEGSSLGESTGTASPLTS